VYRLNTDVVSCCLLLSTCLPACVLPCSVFKPGGFMPPGTTAIEKRTIASFVPTWNSSACTQCNICAFVCPHAAIRPVLATPEELGAAPSGFDTLPIKGSKELSQYQYRMQVGQLFSLCSPAACLLQAGSILQSGS
jgi:ferredoxin